MSCSPWMVYASSMSATFNRRLNRGKVLRITASIVPHIVENYFNYFTEIEEHFQRRRGSILLLSTLDWALIETWKEAGVPLEAVLRGIDAAFDAYDRQPRKTRKVNSLAFCSQEVLAAAEDMKEAAVGSKRATIDRDAGLAADDVGAYLTKNAASLRVAKLQGLPEQVVREAADS